MSKNLDLPLRFGERNVGKGALIGAGAGVGAALLTGLALRERGAEGSYPGVGLFPFYGAGGGAIVGAF
jgi:hypothetical protein